MGKIIKTKNENIIINKQNLSLGMKGEFSIEFVNDNFGPYEYKFAREDCYFNYLLVDRGTKVFPLRNKKFDNTEIFLETDDIIVCSLERASLLGESKNFIDIINLITEKKYRVFTEEVNLIYNTKNELIINANIEGIYKTIYLDINTLEKTKEENKTLFAFFKCIYDNDIKKWYLLDFINIEEGNFTKGYFDLKSIENVNVGNIQYFDRISYEIKLEGNITIDIAKLSNL